MSNADPSPARERVLDAAENLFRSRGFASVTMRDVAAQLGIKVSSLYYHVPNGKEELYLAIVERNMQRHQHGLQHTIQQAGESWQDQLLAAGRWLLEQPPMDMRRFTQSDRHQISPAHADAAFMTMYRALFQPVEAIFDRAQAEIAHPLPHPGLLAGTFLAIVEGFRDAPAPPPSLHIPQSTSSNTLAAFNPGDGFAQVLQVLIKGLLAA